MGRQRFTPEQIITKLREVDVIVGAVGRRSKPVARSALQSKRSIAGARNMAV